MDSLSNESEGIEVRETEILQLCRLKASECGATLWRNNTGKLEDKKGRWVTFGFVGSGDLIGFRNSDGKFISLEVKVPGKKASPEQVRFINAVLKAGGIAGVVYGPEDVEKLLCTTPKS